MYQILQILHFECISKLERRKINKQISHAAHRSMVHNLNYSYL